MTLVKHLAYCFVTFAALLVVAQPSLAAQLASVTVNCTSAKLQAAIDKAMPGVQTIIQVSGTCLELIEVPAGKSITLSGRGKAELKPPSGKTNQPVVLNKGDLTLEQMKVTNNAAATNVILSANSSSLLVYGSTITGGNAEVALEIANASSGRIFNSVVRGGSGEAVGVYNASTLEIFGRPSVIAHFDPKIGYSSVISNGSSTMSAVSCGEASNLSIKVDGTGKVMVRNTGGTGILANLCTFRARNSVAAGAIDVLSKGTALSAVLSDLMLIGVTLASEANYALSATAARTVITGSLIKKSGAGDIRLDGQSSIKFNGWNGSTSLPAAFNAGYPALACMDDSRIFANDGDLQLPSGKTEVDLEEAYPDCFS
jgi:hypothetical protein